MRNIRAVPLAFALVLVTGSTGQALAQLCAGNPAGAGERAVAARIGFSEFATSYGADLEANPRGAFGFDGGYTRVSGRNGGTDGHAFSGGLRYELPVASASVCPLAGLAYSIGEGGAVGSRVVGHHGYSVRFGIGIGKALIESGRVRMVPFAIPRYRVIRATVELADRGDVVDTSGQLDATLGVLANVGRFFGVGSLFMTDGIDPSFTIGAGVVF